MIDYFICGEKSELLQRAFDKVANTYSAEFASKLHHKQLIAVYHSILNREQKQKFYRNTQLSLFV